MPFISASAISLYNKIRGGAAGPAGTLLLDLYPGAVAAYSLRKLSSEYTEYAIKVRVDTTGQPTYDIGFDANGDLDTVDLLSKAGSNSAYVHTWYDQSGNNNNAIQTTASEQPKIVAAGSILIEGGTPKIEFDGLNAFFDLTNNINGSVFSSFVVQRREASGDLSTAFSAIGAIPAVITPLIYTDNNVYQNRYSSFNNRDTALASYDNTDRILFSGIADVGINEIYSQGALLTNSIVTGSLGQSQFNAIGRYGTIHATGSAQEMILYSSDQSANRAGIESNINSYYKIYWDGSQTGLLDDYPDASAAYSLRALSSSYTGPAIRVRRSSGNAVKDIGLLYDGSLDTESLLSFVGAGDGFVTIRYDQSGNGNDLTNISAVNQPKIVSSGQIITENQKPMIDYDGANHYLKTSSGLDFGTSSRSLFLVQKTDVVGFALGRFAIATSSEIGGSWSVTPEIYVRGTGRVWAGQVSTPTISTSLISNIYTSGDLVAGNSMWLDGSSITQSGSTDGSINTSNDPMIEGARGEGTFLFDGKVGDTIIYKSDQSTNRAGIESNINSYYNMYWDGSQAGLLDDYPNAAAAYSLRALSSEYTGAAIKVRKTVAGVVFVQDIGFLYDGSLDTESLLSFAGSQDVFVDTWYDQSGEENDAVQGLGSRQPKIVSSGVVITENGEPSVEFNGATNYIQNQLSVEPTVTAFAVSKIVDEPDYNFIYDSFGTGARLRLGLWNTNGYFADNGDGANATATTASDGSQHLFFAKHSNSEVSISVDQDTLQTVESTNFSQTTQYWNIGARNDGAEHFLEGTIQELILYPSDQSANRAGIESNINSNYNIYWDGSQTGLLDDYPNATAAYSLRALNSAYTGPAIRVTTTGSDFKDIGLLYDGSLDTESLLSFADGGDAFVVKWYDQSGSNDVVQVSQSEQPQIVSSGVVVTTSDNYAIDFSGSTKTLVNATFDNSTQVSSVFTIVKSTSSAPQVITDGVDLASRQVSGYYANNPSVFAINKGVTIKSAAPINTNINLLSTFFDVNSDLYLNGEQILNSINAGSDTREGFTLGSALGSAASFEGSIFEVIVFDGQNKSSDRVTIETNINNYYDVY